MTAQPKPRVNFGAVIGAKPLAGDGPNVLPHHTFAIVDTAQCMEPDTSDRNTSLKADWDEFKASIAAAAAMHQRHIGNHQPIAVCGTRPPYEIVAGRRRFLACRELGLQVEAKIYPVLTPEQKLTIKFSENIERNNYTPAELVHNVMVETAKGFDAPTLARIFNKSLRTIQLYLQIGNDQDLVAEVKRGLGVREALRLIEEHGAGAAAAAVQLREAGPGPTAESHQEAKERKKAEEGPAEKKEVLQVKVLPGKKAVHVFDERNASKRDWERYGEALDEERERVGQVIDAKTRRGAGPKKKRS